MKINRKQTRLEGVSETLLIPLWARAVESRRLQPIVKDKLAAKIVDGIDYDFSKSPLLSIQKVYHIVPCR